MVTVVSEQDYIVHIAALERQCATLAAQVDRQRIVVDAARKIPIAGNLGRWCEWLSRIVQNYDITMARLTEDNVAPAQLTEDYYTLAEIRLAADFTIVEYGSCAARLHGIADLIDKKRPELKPTQLTKDGG